MTRERYIVTRLARGKESPVATKDFQSQQSWARLAPSARCRTRDRLLARAQQTQREHNKARSAHTVHTTEPMIMHCVVHCLGHYSKKKIDPWDLGHYSLGAGSRVVLCPGGGMFVWPVMVVYVDYFVGISYATIDLENQVVFACF